MTITAMPTPAKTLLSPTNHALVLIDFQSQMAFATKSIAPELLRNNAALVSQAAAGFAAYLRGQKQSSFFVTAGSSRTSSPGPMTPSPVFRKNSGSLRVTSGFSSRWSQ